jgi:hypothetical protein
MILLTILGTIVLAGLFAFLLWERGKYLQKKIQESASEPPTKFERAKSQLEIRVWTVADILGRDGWIIPDEKMQAVFDFVTQTFVKHADMKPERVARKTVEYFKLKKMLKAV